MAELWKIRDLSLHLGVTPRTLRYYEEIGLLWSERTDDFAYRQYDAAAIARLEQILLLRKLDLPVKDIQAIFTSGNLQVAVEAFARKLHTIDAEMAALAELKETVEAFLGLLREQGFNQADGFRLLSEGTAALGRWDAPGPEQRKMPQEVRPMPNELDHVRIVELKPMKVAAYRAESTTPEDDAWAVLKAWVEEKGLQHLPTTRFFGFNTSCPGPSKPEYGYEVWVTVPEGMAVAEPVQLKEFAGGLYAVISTHGHEIPERWRQLVEWVKGSDKYARGPHLCLEETTTPYGTVGEEWQMDLLEPIVRK